MLPQERTDLCVPTLATSASSGDVRDTTDGKSALRSSLRVAAAALLATQALSGLLFGVDARDPALFLGVGVALILIVLLASYLPARKATRVEPLIALRYH
jgi:putative ABC transport system permease protein